MLLKVGRFGKFLACETYPQCKHVNQLWKNDTPKKTSSGAEKCVVCGQGPARRFESEMKASEADQILWDEVLLQNTRAVYEFYLREKPDGAYVKEAEQRIGDLTAGPEFAAWNVALEENSKSSYQKFLRKYPKGRFASRAKEKIKKLDRAAESASWKSAIKSGTLSSYQRHLRRHPKGRYASQASLRILEIENKLRLARENDFWEIVERRGTLELHFEYLERFPHGRFVTQAKKKIELLEHAKEEKAWKTAQKIGTSKERYLKYLENYPEGRFRLEASKKIEKFNREEEDDSWKFAEKIGRSEWYLRHLEKYPDGRYSALAKLRLSVRHMTIEQNSAGKSQILYKPEINGMSMEFVGIPWGSFTMGSPRSEVGRKRDEGPKRYILIGDGFFIGRYPVTNSQYQAVMGEISADFRDPDHPVVNVSWADAKEFIRSLNEKGGDFIYSLPSEAEWEYAARAGTDSEYHFGYKLAKTDANIDSGGPTPVGSYRPNEWGLYDIHGNVWEWVEDIYSKDYKGLPTDGSPNTKKGDTTFGVLRGGSWFDLAVHCRSASRYKCDRAFRTPFNGFRIVARER